MPGIAQKVRLFNEAFKLAQVRLSQRGIMVVGVTAERLGKNISGLIEAGKVDADAIAKEAVALIK